MERAPLSLTALLSASTLSGDGWGRARRALAGAWCWPRDVELARRAEAHGFVPPPAPLLGETVLLSAPGREGALWRLARAREGAVQEPAAPAQGPLVLDAAESLALAWAVAARDLPLLVSLDGHLEPPPMAGELLATTGESEPVQLRGRSYGLSFALAAASVLLERPVPARWAATAELRIDGSLAPVHGLRQKAAALGDWGLGVEALLVCDSQVPEARACVAAGGPRLRVVGVRHLVEALELVFGSEPEGASLWPTAAARRRTLAALHRQAMGGGRPLLGWAALGRTAARILELSEAPGERQRAALVCSIARRHEGAPAQLSLPSDDELRLARRPERLELVAQVVQSWTDSRCGAAELREGAAWALRFVNELDAERHVEDYLVLGAVGRALAAAQELSVALGWLQTAIDGMLALRQAQLASRALCECLRVTALASPEQLAPLLNGPLVEVLSDERLTVDSRAFLALAQGRALVQVGSHASGLEVLERASGPWDRAPAHVRDSRDRWRARALAVLGEQRRGQELRAALVHRSGLPGLASLVRLDAALEGGEDGRGPVDELRGNADCGFDVERILAATPPAEGPRQVAERWRY